MNRGYINGRETIFRFKIYEISQKHQAMKNGGMRKQEPETIRKREAILTIIQMLENSDLNDPKTLVNFALKFSQSVIKPVLIEITVFLYIWI